MKSKKRPMRRRAKPVKATHLSSKETDAYHSLYPRPPHRSFIMGRAFFEGRPVHVEDILTDPDYDQGMQVGLQRVHGGKIWVTSTVGVGSTFTFTLPLPQ